MKRQKLLWLSIILFLGLGCNLANIASDANIIPTPTNLPPIIVEVTPTPSPFAAEEANAGLHRYWMSPNENGCDSSDDLQAAQFRDKEHIFAADFNSVNYGNNPYSRVSDHRYQSVNSEGKPLVLVYSKHGFVLFVYEAGDDPNVNDSCLTFSFTLAD
jgi:hypothetical protein